MSWMLVWLGIVGMAVLPYSLGVILENKVKPSERDMGSRLLHRY